MENSPPALLAEGLGLLGLEGALRAPLWRFASELLRWNERVNLTAITAPDQVVEKHLLDSLAVLPEVGGVGRLLDIGAGAGLPGIPLALAAPGLDVTLVEGVGKKVAFMKAAIATLGLIGRVRALQVHARGRPGEEGIAPVDVVVSRAALEVADLITLALPYLRPGGRIVAMLGQPVELEDLARQTGTVVLSQRRFVLPFSREPRGVVVFGPVPRGT